MSVSTMARRFGKIRGVSFRGLGMPVKQFHLSVQMNHRIRLDIGPIIDRRSKVPAAENGSISRRSLTKHALLGLPSLFLAKSIGGLAPGSKPLASRFINVFIGASTSELLGEGKTFPGPTTPFGMVQLSPDTITGGVKGPGYAYEGDSAPGYSYEQKTIEGFSFTHMSGVGWYGDFGNLQVMPTTGPMRLDSGRSDHPGEGWRSAYQHTNERAKVNYYAVTLDNYGIRTELTAAPRAGMLRLNYPESETPRIQLNLARRIGGTSTRQYVKVAGDRAIEGWMLCPPSGGGWGNGDGKVDYTAYFRMEFSKPLERFGVWQIDVPDDAFPVQHGLVTSYFQTDEYQKLVLKGKVLEGCREHEGNHIGFFAEFPSLSTGGRLAIKSGISFVSIEGARKNLLHDIPGWDFEDVRQRGRALWDQALNSIEIEGASEDQKKIFFTAMYHAMIDPRVISDVDGQYTGADKNKHIANGYMPRTIFSGWDVFRGEFPLMTLLNTKVVSDEINSLVALAETSGKGYLERWEIMNAYSGCMDGDPATSVILDAYSKGIKGFDIEKAYAACRQTANGTGTETNRLDNGFYLQHGFVPEQVSWTLDNAYFDWCVGHLAASLGKSHDALHFADRAQNYRKIYDPQVGTMRARNANGEWLPWKGKTEFGQGCTESNPLQQTWFVPHDVAGLIGLMGGEDEFSRQLEDMFENTPASFGWNAYYNHSNEPVHHIPYLFVYAGKPWLTQKWVRRILANAYHNEVNGICGNDDVGQMSAWFVLSALGFYPVCPGSGDYILGAPLFSRAIIHLDKEFYGEKSFEIVAHQQAPKHSYIQSASFNGKPLSRAWLKHSEIAAGGRLELVMGLEPNLNWATSRANRPPSASALP
jgi:predicted alpha-1,2-mannosidase